AATSFHWVNEGAALKKVAELLRPGGWWAMWWQVFGDPDEEDPFHHATEGIMSKLKGNPSGGQSGRPSFALDSEARVAALREVGEFEEIEFEIHRTNHVLDGLGIRRLYATFSEIGRLDADYAREVLDELEQIAR